MTAWSTIAEITAPGDAIRERRIDLGWTQAELAKRTGISQADISRLENGHLDARWSTIQRLMASLAAPDARPRRSLASGRKVASPPTPPSTRWSPKGATMEITDNES